MLPNRLVAVVLEMRTVLSLTLFGIVSRLPFLQVAELSVPGLNSLESEDNILQSSYAAQLARISSTWDNRQDTASHLRDRAETLWAHQQSLAAQVYDLFSSNTFKADSSIQLAQPLPLVQPALARLLAVLQQAASASQQLPSTSSEASSTTTATWNTSIFVVKTVQSVLSSCFNAKSGSGDGMHLEDSWQSSVARHATEALQASLGSWNQTTLVPSIIAQLQQSARNLVSAQQLGAPNGIDPDMLQDLSSLELEPSASGVSGQDANALQGKGSLPAADLVPFSDFDNALAGADQTLESALEDLTELQAIDTKLESEAHAQSDSFMKAIQAGAADISLVPFGDFDEALGGADESLEADGDDGALEPATPSASHSSQYSSLSSAAAATADASSSQVQRLTEAMTQYVLSAGAVAAAEHQVTVVAAARAEAEMSLESGGSAEQLAALEWEHEDLLQEALQLQEGLGPPAVIMPKVCPDLFVHVRMGSDLTAK